MNNENNVKHLSFYIFKKLIKKLILLLVTSLGLFNFILLLIIFIFIVLIGKDASVSQGLDSFTTFSTEVESYRNDVMEICEDEGMVEYTNVVLAIMQAETRGQTLDPMNAGNKIHNKKYPKSRGAIEDPLYSIKVAVLELKDLIRLTSANLEEPDKMLIVYQSYHFDRDFIDYANTNGGYNTSNAAEYLRKSDLPFYLRPSFATNVASFVFIQSGYINTFVYPVDMNQAEITCSFGEEAHGGATSKGTYFKTKGNIEIKAITDGDVVDSSKNSITLQHGKYEIIYRNIEVDDVYLPQYDGNDEDEDYEEPEKTYAEKGDYLGTSRNRNSYEFLLQVKYQGKYIDPMTLLDLTIGKTYDVDSGNNNVRDAIVDYAKLWMSTPYVWGGTSLQKGVDCSGFMQQIYKNFGYSLPRVSRDQANFKGAIWSTTEIYPNMLEKGDLLFYTDKNGVVNHVTMYIGDGLIIGAQSTKTGIKIAQYNYRTPIKAIRVIP